MSRINLKDFPEFQCPHDKGAPLNETHSDYLPIEAPEIAELMMTAIRSSDIALRSHAQTRLSKAIPGIECPRAIEGITSRKETLVGLLYLKELRTGPTQEFMPRFFRIINAQSSKSQF